MNREKTEPSTLRALAEDLARVEAKVDATNKSIDANMKLLLSEMQRYGKAIAELSKAVADHGAKMLEHDQWERTEKRPNGEDGK